MNKKKLSLENLKIKSFITSIESVNSNTFKGGNPASVYFPGLGYLCHTEAMNGNETKTCSEEDGQTIVCIQNSVSGCRLSKLGCSDQEDFTVNQC